MILNFVTEICSNFLTLKIMFWILNFVLQIFKYFPRVENNVFVLITFLEPYRQNEASLVQNNVKFYTKPILLLS